MKKAIGVLVCFCLGGCSQLPSTVVFTKPSPGTQYPYQDTAPSPWITILPTARAIAMKDIDFTVIANALRYEMSYGPHEHRFKNVRFMMVDYGILPPSHPNKKLTVNYEGQTYSQKFEDIPERYILKVSFFEGKSRPPSPPSFEETIYMPTRKAPPLEALSLLAHMLTQDLLRSSRNQIEVNID